VTSDGGNQQYTVRNFNFNGQTAAAIVLLWDWGWTWQQISIYGTPIGILLQNPESKAVVPGSIYLMDSDFQNVGIVIQANQMNPDLSDTSVIVLDNLGMNGVSTVLALANGAAAAIAPGTIDFYLFGNMKNGPSTFGSFGLAIPHPDDSLAPNSTPLYARRSYYVKSRPQYENYPLSSIVDVKSFGAKGDGTTDDTAAVQNALNSATDSNVIYFPSGSYIITSTVKVPSTCRITGRVWSQLVAKGSAFADMLNPTPMIQVGRPGDTGTVEFSDMIFTSIGPLPGLVMVEWNVAASKTGSVGMWDTHFRVGGAIGTKLQAADCPANQPIQSKCIAASLMLHITPSGNGYFENVWAWVADHDLDDAANTQITIAVARGILVESQGPTWLYGTASEHCMLYQYNFEGSVNTFAGMIQTECV
jgi:glucan 1,3-beta-glucosidase